MIAAAHAADVDPQAGFGRVQTRQEIAGQRDAFRARRGAQTIDALEQCGNCAKPLAIALMDVAEPLDSSFDS